MIFFKYRVALCGARCPVPDNPSLDIGMGQVANGFCHLAKLIGTLFTFLFFLMLLFSTVTAKAQSITIQLKDADMEKAFREIKKQSGYGFWYEKDALINAKKVTFSVKDGTLKQVLDICFNGQPLTYEIVDRTVIVKPISKTKNLPTGSPSGNLLLLKGKVVDEKKIPMSGVSIKSFKGAATTADDGSFTVEVDALNTAVEFSYIGYSSVIKTIGDNRYIEVIMYETSSELDAVEVVNTGYQSLPKERASGSFVTIDNELLNRNGATTSILERIEGITSGVNFSKNGFSGNGARQARQSEIEVRGRATLFSNATPLIVLDNFPYDGDLSNINPNDVESITVLKDAAAASAWGARSGNGVIVITTKKGKLNSAPKISFISSLNVAAKPDLYSQPQLSSEQFIEVQQFLFANGAYNAAINDGFSGLSPAVDIMLARRNGTINLAQETSQLDLLRSYDVRDQLLRYNYRKALQQQYQASVTGGGSSQKYFVSFGYNKNLNGTVNSSYDRLTLNASNTYYFVKNKLELFSNIIYTSGKSITGPSLNGEYPYSQFADAMGSPLVQARDLRVSYASAAGNGKLLDWLYRPLDEVNKGYGTTINDLTSYRINLSLSYNVVKGLKISALYGYEKGLTDGSTLNEVQSYYTRNMINRFSQINASSGAVTYPMPMGGILNSSLSNLKSNNGRMQASYSSIWGRHELNAIAGSEIKDQTNFRTAITWYGYSPETSINQNGAISYTTNYPLFYNPSSTSRINPNASQGGNTNRFFSYYFNGSYIFDGKYIATLSARRDESNLFGVDTNQKGVPLWSVGAAWNINKESFYNIPWLPQLKLRGTYGYTGNVNNSISAYLTATTSAGNDYNTNFASIVNPPNPNLRWEKISNINLGLDFSTKENRINGSVDLWQKNGIDLIGNSPIAPQTGAALYTGNSANTTTRGIDLQVNTININGAFKWETTLLHNYASSKVTDYKVSNGNNLNVVSANYNNPLEGYPLYALFSFKYAGLNSSGDPQGFIKGQISTDYTTIRNSIDRNELVYHGSAVPTSFGSLRNIFSFKEFDFSFNVAYKFGYYFRRGSLNNGTLYSGGANGYQMDDYGNRWQQAGDELKTYVPAMVYPSVTNRTNLYTFSDVLVEKADHIRLQDIRLGYTLNPKKHALLKNLNVFGYLGNLGIIWRANKKHIDPDSPNGIPIARTTSFGLRANF